MGEREPLTAEAGSPSPTAWSLWGVARFGVLPLSVVLLSLLLFSPFLQPTAGSPYGAGASNLDALRASAEDAGYEVRTTALSPAALERWNPGRTVLLVADPASPIRAPEAAFIHEWVESGGRLLLADSTGNALELAHRIGVGATPRAIFQASLDDAPPERVTATLATSQGPMSMALSTPLVILDEDAGGEGEHEALVRTTATSFVDLDSDGMLGENDTRGPFTVGVTALDGRAIVITSGAFLQDHLMNERENRDVALTLLASILPDGGTLAIDTSHAARPAGVGHAVAITSALGAQASLGAWRALWPVAVVLLTLGTIWPLVREASAWGLREQDPESVEADGPTGLKAGRMVSVLQAQSVGSAAARRENPTRTELLRALEGLGEDDQGDVS